MIVYPNAKINIGLHVVEKRSDGYHNIESVFYPVSLCDMLEVVEDISKDSETEKRVEMTFSGIEIPGNKNENLCIKAYELLSKDYYLPSVKMHLHKVIPIGAGLGGGSSDGAFCIKALNELFDLNLSFGELHHYARQLGSDCSFFINNQPSFAHQRGDELERIDINLKGLYLVLVYPHIHVSTQEAYSLVIPAKPIHSLEKLGAILPEKWRNTITNDFEKSVIEKYPRVLEIKNKLYELGAVYSSMSGSGSTVFGLFCNPISVENMFSDSFVWVQPSF